MALQNTHWGADAIRTVIESSQSVFFIGVGGVSMCSLAEMTLKIGKKVRGSDRVESERLSRLRSLGAEIFTEQKASNLGLADAVVFTVAIGEDNPEYREAKKRNLPLISRADYLGFLMMQYRSRIGISGMNGKSTVTALTAHILMQSGDPTVFCGAEARELGDTSCRIGEKRETVVFEACEYMDSFLDFSPTLAVILNIGMDHVDYFHSMEQIRTSFLKFALKTGRCGTLLYNGDDAETCRALEPFPGEKISFGMKEQSDFRAVEISSHRGKRSFCLTYKGKVLCRIHLPLVGEFQIYNALAAAAAAYLSGASATDIAKGTATFVGIRRRMEFKGTYNGADVYDDYAHHPSAIEATLKGAEEMEYNRILCAFQPHTYSRTAGLFLEFARSFSKADRVYLADIYAAREQNESGVSSRQLAEAIGEKAVYCGDRFHCAEQILSEAEPGDLVLIMGAGDIEQVFDRITFD